MIYLIVYIVLNLFLYYIKLYYKILKDSKIFLELQKQVKNEVITFIHLFI